MSTTYDISQGSSAAATPAQPTAPAQPQQPQGQPQQQQPQGQQPQPQSPKIALRPMKEGEQIEKWDGSTKHEEGVLAVIGYEDHLQNILMCRFIKAIKEHFSQVYYLVPRPLMDLLKNIDGCDGVYEFEGEVPPVTHYTPLREGLSTLSLSTDGLPYIKIDSATAERWAKRIPDRTDDDEAMRIGLMWDVEHSQIKSEEPNKLNFVLLSNFLRLPVHQFYSLQTGGAALRNEIHNLHDKYYLVDLCPYLANFNEIAGAISRLDLVISGDTATAHLAAAMGCNVWLLQPPAPQAWFWQMEEQQLPEQEPIAEDQLRSRGTMWYQTMRLLFQKTEEDWVQPLQLLMNNLARLRRKSGDAAPQENTGEAKTGGAKSTEPKKADAKKSQTQKEKTD